MKFWLAFSVIAPGGIIGRFDGTQKRNTNPFAPVVAGYTGFGWNTRIYIIVDQYFCFPTALNAVYQNMARFIGRDTFVFSFIKPFVTKGQVAGSTARTTIVAPPL